MKRLKTILRRSLKPFVMAAVAVGLCFSLTVTTTQRAEANPLLLPPLLMASGVMPVGTALGLVSLTGPIGWGLLGIGALAVGLASTQDYWLPYVNGSVGDPHPPPAGDYQGGGGATSIDPQWKITAPPSISDQSKISVPMAYTCITTKCEINVHVAVRVECKQTNGAIFILQRVQSVGGTISNGQVSRPTIGTDCQRDAGGFAGAMPLGAEFGAAGAYTLPTIPAGSPISPIGPSSYYAWGSKNQSSGGFDPNTADMKYKTTVECVKPDGTFFSLTAESTGADGAVKVPSCDAAVPGSHGTGKTDVVGYPPGTTTPQPLWNNPRIPASAEYPLCGPERPGPMCSLAVKVDGVPCVEAVGSWNCAHWREIANADAGSPTPRVQCSYGPYAGLAVDVCNPMERAYESPGGTVATEPNLDGNPSTRNDSNPAGEPYQKPDGSTAPGGTVATAPSSGINPGSNPGEDGKNCLATGWSWNPVSWVMVPTQCALQWAFVPPKVRVDAAIATVIPKMEIRGIQPFVIPVMTALDGLGGSGCQGPAFDLSAIHIPQTYYFFSACEAPMSHIATGVNSFFALSIVVQGGMSIVRGVAAAFGFNWGLGSKSGDED